jgi:hypothetical protein
MGNGMTLFIYVIAMLVSIAALIGMVLLALLLTGKIGPGDIINSPPQSNSITDALNYAQETLITATIANLKGKNLEWVTLFFLIVLGLLGLALLISLVTKFARAWWRGLVVAMAAMALPISIIFFAVASYWFGSIFLTFFALLIVYSWPSIANWYRRLNPVERLKDDAKDLLESYKKTYSDKDTKLFEDYIKNGTKDSLSGLINMLEAEKLQHNNREEIRQLARAAEEKRSAQEKKG